MNEKRQSAYTKFEMIKILELSKKKTLKQLCKNTSKNNCKHSRNNEKEKNLAKNKRYKEPDGDFRT